MYILLHNCFCLHYNICACCCCFKTGYILHCCERLIKKQKHNSIIFQYHYKHTVFTEFRSLHEILIRQQSLDKQLCFILSQCCLFSSFGKRVLQVQHRNKYVVIMLPKTFKIRGGGGVSHLKHNHKG